MTANSHVYRLDNPATPPPPKDGRSVFLWARLPLFGHVWHKAFFDDGWSKTWRTARHHKRLLEPTHWAPFNPSLPPEVKS